MACRWIAAPMSAEGLRADNLKAGALMVFAMAGFALADASIKVASEYTSTAVVLTCFGVFSGGILAVAAKIARHPLVSREIFHPAVLLRAVAEVLATLGIVNAVSMADLSQVAVIQQASPLIVVAGAALVFGERIGWRRLSALGIGVLGMLLILRPTGAGELQAGLLWAVLAAVGFAARDLCTRAVPRRIHSLQISTWSTLPLLPIGLAMIAIDGEAPFAVAAIWPIFWAVVTSVTAYYAITSAMRIGEISAVAPLRYTRLVFAAAAGMIFFGERPDLLTWVGATLIVGSGLFALLRGRRAASAT